MVEKNRFLKKRLPRIRKDMTEKYVSNFLVKFRSQCEFLWSPGFSVTWQLCEHTLLYSSFSRNQHQTNLIQSYNYILFEYVVS